MPQRVPSQKVRRMLRLLDLADALQRVAEVVLQVGASGLERNRAVQMLQAARTLAGFDQGNTEIALRAGLRWIGGDGLFVRGDRFER